MAGFTDFSLFVDADNISKNTIHELFPLFNINFNYVFISGNNSGKCVRAWSEELSKFVNKNTTKVNCLVTPSLKNCADGAILLEIGCYITKQTLQGKKCKFFLVTNDKMMIYNVVRKFPMSHIIVTVKDVADYCTKNGFSVTYLANLVSNTEIFPITYGNKLGDKIILNIVKQSQVEKDNKGVYVSIAITKFCKRFVSQKLISQNSKHKIKLINKITTKKIVVVDGSICKIYL